MGISLLGIVGVQLYWIRQAVKLSQENFHSSVNDALKRVAGQLKEREIVLKLFGTEPRKWVSDSLAQADTTFLDVEVFADSMGAVVRKNQIVIRTDKGTREEQHEIHIHRDELEEVENVFISTLVEIKNAGLSIEERLDSARVDSLLGAALAAEGIGDMAYRFLISSGPEQRVSFGGKGEDTEALLNSPYEVPLFAGFGGGEIHLLKVYFPYQGLYSLRAVGWMAAASVFFTAIILLCFWLSVRTIFRQKKLSQMKTDFINNMTHELKTPIATISVAADTLQRSGTQLSHYLGIIKAENERMHRQVERVLQAASFDQGSLRLNCTEFAAHELLQSVGERFSLQLTGRQGKLRMQLQAQRDTLYADAESLEQMVSNLLDNANKYSPQRPHITLATRNEAGMLVISVGDQGPGIRPAEQARIFERFYRIPTGNLHEVKGFGLGLSFVREMAEAQGGEVRLHSQPGKGSTFELWLPLSS